MQVMARAENTVFLRVEEKESNPENFQCVCLPGEKGLWVGAGSAVRIGPGFSGSAKLRTVS